MVNSVSILGSTGSIGRQTASVTEYLGIKVNALAASRSTAILENQARRLKPKFVAVFDENAAKEFKIALSDTDIQVGSGMSGLIEAAAGNYSECVVTAVSGSVGLEPTMAAINEKKRIALANKETLVCAGSLVMKRAAETGSEIIPVDSEHSAVFQSLAGRNKGELKRILLTASGGPFRGKLLSELKNVTPQQAVKHPKWNMGAKISVDSATMMNKGLEFIEAMHLFGLSPDDIQVVVHPQSVIHSMVELIDGTVIAQLGVQDMGLPIQYALTYPERRASMFEHLDFWKMNDLTFEAPDLKNTPCLALAMEMAKRGGTGPCVMSAANEVSVHLFLKEKIGFNRIYDLTAEAVDKIGIISEPDMSVIIEADKAARKFVEDNY